MSLSNAYMVRELTPLLIDNNNPTDTKIRSIIRDVDSKIGLWLATRYVNPIIPTSYLTGTISISKDDKTLEGSGTTFTNLLPGQSIQITGTGEVLRILTINSNTSITFDSEAVNAASGSTFWIIPDELVTASKYLSAHLIIMLYFSEKTINQDNVEKFDRRLEFFATDIIKRIETGDYLNTSLTEQIDSKNHARLLYSSTSNDIRTRINTNHDLFISSTDFV